MKNVKLSLFITALTLAIAIPTGVYAQGNDGDSDSRSHKNECKSVKMQVSSENYKQNNSYKKDESKKRIDYKKDESKKQIDYKKDNINKNKCVKPDEINNTIDEKKVLSTEDKAALQVKKDAIEKVKADNKVLKNSIKTNKTAVKVELKRIKESDLTLTPEVQATLDELLFNMKNHAIVKAHLNCPEKEIEGDAVVTPVVAVVEPKVEVAPVTDVLQPKVEATTDTTVLEPVVEVEKTYVEKLQARLDNALIAHTTKNTKLTEFSLKIIDLLAALKLIQ